MNTLAERFWRRVDKSGDCWLWTSTGGVNRYALFAAGGRNVLAHRWAYEQLVGAIPDGLTLDHLCRVRNCVNPAHLEPVTNRENILRGTGPTALNAVKTHCKHGHEFTPANTIVTKQGRQCRACARRIGAEWVRQRRRAQKEAAA